MNDIYNLTILEIVSKFKKIQQIDSNELNICEDSFIYGSMYDGPKDFSEIAELCSNDPVVYYMARSVSYKNNFYFDKKALFDVNNYILFNFEILVNKCYKLCVEVCYPNDPFVPPYKNNELENPFDTNKFVAEFKYHFIKLEIRKAILLLECVVENSIEHIDYILNMKKYSKDEKYLEKYANKYLNLIYMLSHYYALTCPDFSDYIVKKVLFSDFVSLDKLNLEILQHNKNIIKTDKIKFITILQ